MTQLPTGLCYRRGYYTRKGIMSYIDFVSDYNALIAAYKRVHRVSGWKCSAQKAGINLLKEVQALSEEIESTSYRPGEGVTFQMCERGNLRLVRALNVRDTIAQQALCQSLLIPVLERYLIYDNGASLKGKGISFTRRRFEEHLRWHYRRYGTDGYALKIDFRKYFDNIEHEKLLKMILTKIPDARLKIVLQHILESNRQDVSYDQRNIDEIMQEPFNSLEHEKIPNEKLTGQKFLPKSLGIGSPLSQIAGIFFPTRIDTYCKTVRQLHCYDAYMDDRIILHPDKEYLKRLRGDIEHIAGEMGLFVHPKKTQIIKISHGITFLKTKYLLTDTGRIVRRIPHDTITTERRKLKALARLVAAGKMDYAAFTRQYLSWRGDKEWYNAHRTVRNMDNLYRRLKAWLKQQKKQQARQTPRGNRSLKKSRKSPT